ncbi:MAG: hypothetical protein UY72_C0049G0003 [Candidatus Uhrbacteria bacterium GW2011_GWD2_52_7]|uniref:Uncharacterized protein n=1 Tax=Candidatus Uhrbacteria bacterium GW2011_GWD2_52_7 TaxID=1618989 RepID=A0A0G1XEE4_9BACT|nr:MAG: hypothetical protein UY72_C0049G0003 [Candidatus Uhrbacteria bacterium GW2011_GWD2_52_7]
MMVGELLVVNNQTLRSDLTYEIREEMHSLIAASETRMTTLVKQEIKGVREDIQLLRTEVVEIIDESILPQITDLQLRIA